MKSSSIQNEIYNVLGGVIRLGVSIATIPMLIYHLGIESYGIWSLTSAVTGVVALAEAGMSTATTVFISQDINSKNQKSLCQTITVSIVISLTISIIAASFLWANSNKIASLFFQLNNTQQISLSKTLELGALIVWAKLMQQVCIGIEQAYQLYITVNIMSTLQLLVVNAGMILLVSFNNSLVILFYWQALISIIFLLGHIFVSASFLKGIKISYNWNGNKAISMVKYSSVVWISSLGSAVFSRADRLVVGSLLSPEILGMYSAITDITTQINGISALPAQPLVPFLSRCSISNRDDLEIIRHKIKQSVELNAFVSLGLGGALITMAPFILDFLLGNKLITIDIIAFTIATTIYSIYSLNAVGYYVLLGINAANICAIIQLSIGLISLLLISIGAKNFGLTGAVLGNSFYLFIYGLTFTSLRYLNIPNISWFKWLFQPLMWFGLVLLVSFFRFPLTTSLIILVIQSLVLTNWIAHQYFKNSHL